MLSKRVILNTLLKKNLPLNISQVANHSTGGYHDERLPIGNREWVCYGMTSHPHYVDRPDFPMPAVRFKEIKGDLIALREKEKGDWKKLSLEEKKTLYRASFRQTLVEADAPTGRWKSYLGITLFFVSLGVASYILQRLFIYGPLPPTFSEEYRAAMLRKMIDLKMGHLTGVSSRWDYEKDDWKK